LIINKSGDVQAKQTQTDERLASIDHHLRQSAIQERETTTLLQSVRGEQADLVVRLSALHAKVSVFQHQQQASAVRIQRLIQPQASAAVGSAANTVFAIPELLTIILENLGFGDLVRADSVGRKFRDAIVNSSILQQNLWQKPRDPSSEQELLPLRRRFGLSLHKIRAHGDAYEVRNVIRPCAL